MKTSIALLPVLLFACQSSSTAPAPAPSVSSSAAAPASAASAAPPEVAGEKLPANASIRFHWFAYAAKTHDAHKLWLDPMDPQGRTLALTYAPSAGAAPPREQVPAAAREPLAKALEASKIGAWRAGQPKPGVEAKWNYVLSATWPREGLTPAAHTISWTDATETPELAAVRRALVALGVGKFPTVASAAPAL